MNNNPNDKKRSIWSYVAFPAILIIVLALVLYYFIIRPSMSVKVTKTFTNADIRQNVDHPTKADDFSGSFVTFLAGDETDKNGDSETVTSVSSTKSINTELYYVTGTFDVVNSNTGKKTTYGFTATLDPDTYVSFKTYLGILKDSQEISYTGVVEQTTSNVWSWLSPLLWLVLIVGLGWYMTRSLNRAAGGNSQIMTFNKSRAKQTTSKVRFSDVAGCDEVKNELIEVVQYFHDKDKYKKMGAKLPKGILLVGPPGTGKTLLAKAVAGEAKVPFYSISGSDFVEMYVGVGAGRVRDMFATAKKNAPCLIFIDEIDAVGRQRGAGLGGGNDEREQTLNQLLVEMDGFEDNSGVIVMAATNREDVLDPALLRPGRFDQTITVDLPDKEGREAILKVHARNKPLAKDVDFKSIASRTVGFSGADLAEVLNDAAILAVRNKEDAITMPDIDEAIDRRIAGPAKKSHMDEADKRQVAFHEAGHAIIGLTLPDADKVQAVSIIPRGRTGGHTLMAPDHDRFLYTKNMLLARITGYLGGRVSEQIFFGDVSTGASDDFNKATKIARAMVTSYGMSELGPVQYEDPNQDVFLGRDYTNGQKNFSAQVAYEIDQAERKIIDQCYKQAFDIITQKRETVELIAKALMEKETITAAEIKYLLEHKELPKYEDHKIDDKKAESKTIIDGYAPVNKNNIELKPEYGTLYKEIDDLVAHNFKDIVICTYKEGDAALSPIELKAKIEQNFGQDKVGIIFVDPNKVSADKFVELLPHFEAYSGDKMLLVSTDKNSYESIKKLIKGL